jgi:hypothetical protein
MHQINFHLSRKQPFFIELLFSASVITGVSLINLMPLRKKVEWTRFETVTTAGASRITPTVVVIV